MLHTLRSGAATLLGVGFTCDQLTYRLLRHALELSKPVLILNVGPTRADIIMPPVEKIEVSSGLVLRQVVHHLVCVSILLFEACF